MTTISLKNLTSHPVTLSGKTFFPSGTIARLAEKAEETVHVDDVDGIIEGDVVPVYIVSYTEVEGLPDPQPGTWYIVSLPVAQAVAGKRGDVFFPYPLQRDSEGRVSGLAFSGS